MCFGRSGGICAKCKNESICDSIQHDILHELRVKASNQLEKVIPARFHIKFQDTLYIENCENFVMKNGNRRGRTGKDTS